ncbi:hypothetical protein SSS_07121 [Sarcoptes scabiei]|nr:hypothetical protein SSS_07121 [Sarcoptes scabiei]
MDWFSKKPSKESPLNPTRELSHAQRQVQRADLQLEREEKRLESQIKQLAKQGQTQTCKKLAKQLVELRKQKGRNKMAESQIAAIGSKTKVIGANQALLNALKSSSKVFLP